jgi:hypothetical protein
MLRQSSRSDLSSAVHAAGANSEKLPFDKLNLQWADWLRIAKNRLVTRNR